MECYYYTHTNKHRAYYQENNEINHNFIVNDDVQKLPINQEYCKTIGKTCNLV